MISKIAHLRGQNHHDEGRTVKCQSELHANPKRKNLFGYVNEMRMRREYVRLLQNEGCAKLKPYSVRLQNKKGAWLPFLMRQMLTRVSEAGWTGGTQGQKQSKCNQAKVANAQPKEEPDVSPQVLKQAAALMTAGVLNIPHRASCYRREEWRFAVVSPTHPQL